MTHSTWEDGLYCSERLASVDSARETPSSPRTCSCCLAPPGPHGRPSSRSQPRVFLLGSPVGSGSSSVHSCLFLTSLPPQAGRKPLSKLRQAGQRPVASYHRSLPADGPVVQPLRQDQVPWCCWLAASPWGRVLSLGPWLLPRPIFSITLVCRGQDDIQGKSSRGIPSLGSWWRAHGSGELTAPPAPPRSPPEGSSVFRLCGPGGGSVCSASVSSTRPLRSPVGFLQIR